jgi:hypothetical protein
MTPAATITGVVGGLLLATLPFLHYAPLAGPVAAHADHEPRYGGQLGMVGEHHVEVVRRRGEVQVFLSDAWRRPVRPERGWARFDGSAMQPLVWRQHRLVGPDQPDARIITVEIVVNDATRLTTSFVVGDEPPRVRHP